MKIIHRIYSDFLLPDRMADYEKFIQQSLDAGFQYFNIRDFYESTTAGNIDKNQKFIINRHDIDTDVGAAKKFFAIEQKYQIKATYYFRLSTIDVKFAKQVHESGAEVGYHYEELSTYCKRHHIKSQTAARAHFPEMKLLFEKNMTALEKLFGIKIETVASHGDFANRILDLQNLEILKDDDLRARMGIRVEAYDPIIIKAVELCMSDRPYPEFYFPLSFFEAITRYHRLHLLTHPRHWGRNPLENLRDDVSRLFEGLFW